MPAKGKLMDGKLITFFDVETPNQHNDRICSIGLVQTDMSGRVVDAKSMLIDPEAPFSDVNMRVHGIAPVDVRGKMTFPEAWESVLSTALSGPLLVAHNATFDLCVLSKTLMAYGIDRHEVGYVCTKRMAEVTHPEFESYRLPFVCSRLGVALSHHHSAASDAAACEGVFWALAPEVRDLASIVGRYWFEPCQDRPLHHAERHLSGKTEAMRRLMARVEAIVQDGSVSTGEAMELLDAIAGDEELSADKTVSGILGILQDAAADGEIDAQESDVLSEELNHLLNPTACSGERPDVEYAGKRFCLSGNFEHGSKDSVAEFIALRGGEVIPSVTKKCDYVVVGGCGNEAWSLGNYGTKVKKALDWQAKGVPVQIVSEAVLFGE